MTRDVRVFLAIAFGLPWVIWVVEQLTGIRVLFWAAMVSVAIATFVAVKWFWKPADVARATAILPVRPAGRLVRWCLIAFGLFVAMSAVAVALNAVTGLHPFELSGDVTGLLISSLIQFVLILGLTFCEEWGWRGYLLNRLGERMGTWPAMVLIGALAGVWHLPFYLHPWFSMSADARQTFVPFVIFCVLFGVILSLLRLAHGSIWPAVVGHAVNNTVVVGFVQTAGWKESYQLNAWLHGLSGWQGWLVMVAVIALLARRVRASIPGS